MNECDSRINTIVHLLSQIRADIQGTNVVLYLLGCDDREVFDVRVLCDRLQASLPQGAGRMKPLLGVDIYLIGPSAVECNDSFIIASGTPVSVRGIRGLFHDIDRTHVPSPTAVFIFNGGLWGYDSWIPSLELLSVMHGAYILVTSYTMEEAEDDADVIDTVFSDKNRWVWEASVNPFRSTVVLERHTQPNHRLYFDNYAYQCLYVL